MMKEIKSPHFTELLEIFTFLKACCMSSKVQTPKLMNNMRFEEFVVNLEESQYEAQLLKEIIMFLLKELRKQKPNKKFPYQSTLTLLSGYFGNISDSFIEEYYLQIAINQYLILTQNNQSERQNFRNVDSFAQLALQQKIGIFISLINHLEFKITVLNSSQQKESQEQIKRREKQKQSQKEKMMQVKENVILGQDEQALYFYCPYLPEFIFKNRMGKWKCYNKIETTLLIQRLLHEQESNNLLFLILNIQHIYQNYQIQIKKLEKPEVKRFSSKKGISKLFQQIKQEFFQFEKNYCQYLERYFNGYYAPMRARITLKEELKHAKTLPQLRAWGQQFLSRTLSNSSIYICTQLEKNIPLDASSQIQFYQMKPVKRPLTKYSRLKLFGTNTVYLYQFIQQFLNQNYVDLIPKLKIILILLKDELKKIESSHLREIERKKQLEELKKNKKEEKIKKAEGKVWVQKVERKKRKGVKIIDYQLSDQEEVSNFSD